MYAAHRILVTHLPLLAIHLQPGIHLQLHILPIVDLDLLPAIHLQLLPTIKPLPSIDLDLLHIGLEVVQVMQAWSRRGLETWRYGGLESVYLGMKVWRVCRYGGLNGVWYGGVEGM
jgi:hypothetical protein